MQEPVERCGSHDGVSGEDLSPVGEGLVAGKDNGLPLLVALADGLKQEAGVSLFEREIADFVDDEQLGPGEILDLAREAVLGDGTGHAAAKVDGGSEVDAVSHVRGQYLYRFSRKYHIWGKCVLE